MELLDLQYGVLGHLLLYPEHVGAVAAQLSPEDFDASPTRGLFEAISRLHFAGAPVDRVTVLREAGEDYAPAIQEALRNAASDGLYYCSLLREGMQLQKLQAQAMDLAQASTMAEAARAVDRLNSLVTLRRKTEPVSAHEAAADFIRRMNAGRPDYLSLGMKELDEKLYLELGDFVLLGGYSSAGKTLLSLQFALALVEKRRVGYFTLETNTQKLTDRLVAHMAQVPLSAIKERRLVGEDARRAVEASRRLDKLDLDLIPASGMTVRDIQAATLNRRYQAVFVDYLQIISAPGKSRYEQVTNISMALHTLAQSHGVAVFALAQLSRPEKTGGVPVPPSLSSFRESGQLEQDADAALLLWPADPNDNNSNRVLKIAKNKDGERGKLELAFSGATQTFSPATGDGKAVAAHYAAVGRKARQRRAAQLGFQDIQDNGSPAPFDENTGKDA